MAERKKRTPAKLRDHGLEAGLMTLEAEMAPVAKSADVSAGGLPKTEFLSEGSMIETNGAGSLENVPGFDSYVARNRGLFMAPAAPIASTKTDSFAPENVIGPDDRVLVPDTTALPWRAIAMLTITYETGKRAMGTAWFLGPKALGTAAHNIRHPDFGRAREILVTPAWNGEVAPFGTYYASQTWCDPAWMDGNFDARLDYGVLRLNDDTVGTRLGWFGFAAYDDVQLSRLLVNVSGYVVDRTPQTQYFNGGRLASASPQFLLYEFDTEGGMSGSPIFALFDKKRVVLGIHTYGSDRGNRARRIDSDLFGVLQHFV